MKLKTVKRLDSIPLSPAFFTPEGYLRDRPVVTTCGIFEYIGENGEIERELRLPEEVFAPESLESYKGKPIIITHDAGEVNKDNARQEQIGTILSPGQRDGDSVRAEIVIHDTDAMKACGLKELSLGYDVDLDPTPGTWRGQPYDSIQRNIRINHLALVDEARAGHTARLNLDGKKNKNPKGGAKKMEARKDGAGILTPEQLEEAIEMYMAAHQADLPTADEGEVQEEKSPVERIRENADRRDADVSAVTAEEIPQMHEEIKTLLGEIDKLQGANDVTGADRAGCLPNKDEGETATDPDKQDADDTDPDKTDGDDTQAPAEDTTMKMDAAERTFADMYAICQMAAKLNLDGFTPRSVLDGKKAIIRAVNPKVRLDGKSREYVDGAYEAACTAIASRKSTSAQKAKAYGTMNADAASLPGESEAEKARKRMIENMRKRGNN